MNFTGNIFSENNFDVQELEQFGGKLLTDELFEQIEQTGGKGKGRGKKKKMKKKSKKKKKKKSKKSKKSK